MPDQTTPLPQWFYLVTYQFPTVDGQTYGDTTFRAGRRIDDEATVRELREALVDFVDRDDSDRIGPPVIMGITLLGQPEGGAA